MEEEWKMKKKVGKKVDLPTKFSLLHCMQFGLL